MKRALIALASTAALLTLSGCASFQPSTSVHTLATNQPSFIDMDASRRGVVIIPRVGGGYVTCSEPSPDVALETVTRILAEAKTSGSANIDAKAEAEFRTAVVQLSRTATSLRFLREAMFRICEQSINQDLSAEQVTKLYELAILTSLKLAEADLAKNQTELAKELSDPKVREIWQQVFGVQPVTGTAK
jgi:DNA-binding transcriptional regulator YdaS (Cro superfamily)